MKKVFTVCSLILGLAGSAYSSNEGKTLNTTGNTSKVMSIDALDSVFFDLSQATINGTTIEFPVYIKSDDPINSLDFSFKYDHASCDYDTILNLTPYIEMLTNYNTNDSTVYFTSYSFTQTYANNTSLVTVRFNFNTGVFNPSNIYGISAYLNGDACSYAVVGVSTGVEEPSLAALTTVYPNPATDVLNINAPEAIYVELISMQGGYVVYNSEDKSNSHKINLSQIAAGVYTIRMSDGNKVATKKLVVTR